MSLQAWLYQRAQCALGDSAVVARCGTLNLTGCVRVLRPSSRKAALALIVDGFSHAQGECLVNNSNTNTNNTNTVAIVIGTVIVVLLLVLVFGGDRMMTGGMMNW